MWNEKGRGILVYKCHEINLRCLPKFPLWSLSVLYHRLSKMENYTINFNKPSGTKLVLQSPSMKPTLTWWGGFQIKLFQQSPSTRRAQRSVAVTTIRLNGFSLLLRQNLSQCWLDKIKKAFSSKTWSLSVYFRFYNIVFVLRQDCFQG